MTHRMKLHNSMKATRMGVLFLLTMILQTLIIGNISSALVIHEDEHGNPVLSFNGTELEDFFLSDYYYDDVNSTSDYGDFNYSLYEILATKVTPTESHGVNIKNSATCLLQLQCYLSFFLFLHLLHFLPQGTRMRFYKTGHELPA